jgi:hypothetical protein
MKFQLRTLFTLAIVIFSTYAVVSARDWPLGTRVFPWIVGIPLMTLSIIQLAREIFQARSITAPRKEDTGDLQVDWSMGSGVVGAKALRFYGWLVGFLFCIWLLGFFIAVPLYTFLYLKISARENWLTTISLSLATFIFFIGLFDQVLHLPWPTPVIDRPEELIRGVIPQLDFWN